MHLLIDLGNTRLKWAFGGPGDRRRGATVYQGREMNDLLNEAWGEMPAPAAVVMVSVAADATWRSIERWVAQRWGAPVHRVKPQPEQLGVVNRYRDPLALGADRWVAMIGARGELPATAVCVADCGTAVTIDALSAPGEFVGGVIFPGLALLRQALNGGTAGIRAAEGDETSCLARSTADAVAAGTVYGLAGAIERVCHEFEQSLGEPLKLVITGGDADHVAAHLRRPARRIPDLVLKGLQRIAATL